jgi:hypothetical protein
MNQPLENRPLTATETDALRARQRERNKVMALILGFLVILFFAISIVKIAAKPPHAPAEGAEQAEHS